MTNSNILHLIKFKSNISYIATETNVILLITEKVIILRN